MFRFVLNRGTSLVAVLVALLVIVFVASRSGGADPVRAYLGANASRAAVAAERHRLALDQPLPAQFWNYLTRLVHGDLGLSLSTRQPVVVELGQRLPATMELAAWTVVFAILLALLLSRSTSVTGRVGAVVRLVLFSAASAPSFLVATLGVLLFFSALHLLPVSGRTSIGPTQGMTGMFVLDGLLAGNIGYAADAAAHLLLPAFAASLGPGVALARVLGVGLSSGMHSPWARTARSLGENEATILRRHGLRNAASPALSLLGVQIGMMLSSLVVVEQIFSWNGLGQYLSLAIGAADVNSVAAISLVLGAGYVLVNAIVDVLLAVVDPRVRLN